MKIIHLAKMSIRMVVLISVYCLLIGSLSAQEPLKLEGRVYVNAEGRAYIQKVLPVYLRIATSPDSDSKTYLLRSEVTKAYSNPMYFDTEGYNTIRSPSAVDSISKKTVYPMQDIIYEVYADGYPPKTRAKFTGTNYYSKNGNKYFGSDLEIIINAVDGLSGIDKTYYSVNGENYKQYSQSILKKNEGEFKLKYYSVDNVGNVEEPKEEAFSIDFSAPETQYEIKGLLSENFVSPDAKIILSSKDDISGVKSIYYQINNGTVMKYYSPIPVKVLGNESGSISFYAIDNLGNKEKKKVIGSLPSELELDENTDNENMVFKFYVDNKPPEVSLGIEGDTYKGKFFYVSAESEIKITAEDDKSGVDKIKYSINNSSLSEVYIKPLKINNAGLQFIHYASVDFVGNTSPIKIEKVFVDLTAPVTKIIFSGLNFFNRDTMYITEDTEFSINYSETESGINKVYYKIDEEEFKEYSSPIKIKKAGFHSITYYGSDNLNNQEKQKVQGAFVDNKPPVIHYHFNVAPIGSKNVREEDYTIYPGNTILYLGATDYESGGERIEYTINGGTVKTELPINNFKTGNYVIEISAFDELKNNQTKNLKFSIEK